jgi:hypothetical protein
MTSTRGKQIKIFCSLVVGFAVALVPASGIGNSSAEAAETAQRAPANCGSIELWQTFADSFSGMSRFAATHNIRPYSSLGMSRDDLRGWVSDYTSLERQWHGNHSAKLAATACPREIPPSLQGTCLWVRTWKPSLSSKLAVFLNSSRFWNTPPLKATCLMPVSLAIR